MDEVRISVVMSVYNAEDFLAEAIESILDQTFKDFEFIIVNDGSTDSSLSIIESFSDPRIVIIDQSNKGLSYSLNVGIRRARSQYIARMDADDISLSGRLQEQYDFLKQNPKCILVGSNAEFIDKNGYFLYTSSNPSTWQEIKDFLPESSFFHSSVMFRKECWELCGGYKEEIGQHFEDKILWNEMAKLGELRNLKKTLIQYRIVPSSISNRSQKTIATLKKISNRIIETGTITEADLVLLRKATSIKKNAKTANYYLRLASIYLNQNFNKKLALKNTAKSLRYNPINTKMWCYLFLCLLPEKVFHTWRKRRTG